MVILAVKPHIIPIALEDLKKVPDVRADKLFISVAMGVTTKQLQQVSKISVGCSNNNKLGNIGSFAFYSIRNEH